MWVGVWGLGFGVWGCGWGGWEGGTSNLFLILSEFIIMFIILISKFNLRIYCGTILFKIHLDIESNYTLL